MLLALLLSQVLAPANPDGPIFTNPATQGSTEFQAFGSSGAGTFGPCSTTAPTSRDGQALTLTRASAAPCLKTASGGTARTGIATGDVVDLPSGQARIVYGNDGKLGPHLEPLRINFCQRGNEIDNAIWVRQSDSAPRDPTVTANYGLAPDGASTAERVQFPAASGAQYSSIYQTWTAGAVADPVTCSFYVRGVSNSDSTDVCSYNGATWLCTPCNYVSDSWSVCAYEGRAGSGTTARYCMLGNNASYPGGAAHNAADVLVARAQGEAGLFLTTPIPTGAATAQRNEDRADFMGIMPSQTTRCLAVTFSPNPGISPIASGGTVQFSGGVAGANIADPYFWLYTNGNKINLETRTTGAPSPAVVSGAGFPDIATTAGSTTRWVAYMKATHIGLCQNGVCATETAFTPGVFTHTRLQIGAAAAAGPNAGVYTDIQADTNPLRCRR